jgi:hypothetical protein
VPKNEALLVGTLRFALPLEAGNVLVEPNVNNGLLKPVVEAIPAEPNIKFVVDVVAAVVIVGTDKIAGVVPKTNGEAFTFKSGFVVVATAVVVEPPNVKSCALGC